MNSRIKDYFAFNKKEQQGMIVLLGLMLLAIAFNFLMPYFITEEEFDITPFRLEAERFLAEVKKQDSIQTVNKSFASHFSGDKNQLLHTFKSAPYNFDPNVLVEEQWLQMDMPPFIIKNILRYREKGGFFRNKEGFRKIYGMNDEIYIILEDYILIKENEKNTFSLKNSGTDNQYSKPTQTNKNDAKSEKVDPIDLNSADSAALLSLNGIGPSYSSRIIKYRDRLGGFIRVEQLLEIKGMDSLRLAGFTDQLFIDQGKIKKIDLNQTTFKEMLRHPYFEYYLVKAIFNYKDEIGSFDSVGQLRTLAVMYEELYNEIAPYLEVLQKSE